MSKVVATTVLPEDSGEVLTIGDTGDAIAISGDSLNLNVLQDAGGNNIFTSNGSGTLTVPSAFGGAFNLLATNTFTGISASAFTTLIDSTYDVYIFKFNAINPATDDVDFTFQCSIDGGSSWNRNMTTTYFRANHGEDGSGQGLAYKTGDDQANDNDYQHLGNHMGNGADECFAGELYLFNPASTTLAKNFYATGQYYAYDNVTHNTYIGGYIQTPDINAINFKMSSGNMDGEIKMYGISKS